MIDAKTVVSSRGQIVIPKFIRDRVGLHTGSKLLIHLREDKTLELQPIKRSIVQFFGQGASVIKTASASPIDIDRTIEEAVLDNLKDPSASKV